MTFTLEKRITANIHLGHPTRYWNPKIAIYTYGVRNGVHLIDLIKTCKQLDIAKKFLSKIQQEKGDILFIGTKRQAAQPIKESATASKSFFC
jgi:small subunit ribosomal protein S2